MAILEEYWGYPSFRNLLMYKDVRDPKKQLIEISQAQIINDIVEQTVLALDNKAYRDIYITSATGSGKSVMFQVPSLYLSREFSAENPLTLIISPLIGLMNDQVDSLRARGVDTARTIHSNVAPFERDKIINEIANGQVNMLYLSPETLQIRSDIKMLIGDRRIGLVIIDEAHIVTTWGKSFRADYWYLGIYLQKLRKKYRFPIVTFTATAIYGGKEDMYLETRDSLNLINPISYFGNVKRDDIYMCVSSSDEKTEDYSREYLRTKQQLTLAHLERAFKKKQKSLVYFPTVKLLNQFNSFLKLNDSEIAAVTGIYNGQLQKEEKDEVLTSFKNGELRFVLATKAFGMGIDIPDITNVYHYAPSGSVTDYIQEIGRVARDEKLVLYGFAWLDFLHRDFTEVKRLHGMGKITKDQLLAVMNKIINLYHEKGNNRNLVISAVDFKHIFRDDSYNSDDSNLDNKLKTALLLIEKDFESPNNIGFPPFAARPRSVFGIDNILVNEEIEQKLKKSPIKKYLKLTHYLQNSHYKAIYTVNLSDLWEDHYKHLSFPQFKYMLFTPEERLNLKHAAYFDDFVYATGISITKFEDQKINDVLSQFNLYVRFFEEFVADKKRTASYFSISELGYYLQDKMHLSDIFKARAVAQAFVNTCFEYQKVKNYKFIKERPTLNESTYVLNNNYDIFISFIKDTFNNFFRNKVTYFENKDEFIKYYHRTKKANAFDLDIIPLGLAEAIGLMNFNVENGNNPQIYIRINAISPLESAIKKNQFYTNRLLNDVHMKHHISVEMLTYLFKYQAEGSSQSEKVQNYTDFFWETVENYFLGIVPAPVEEAIAYQAEKRFNK
ncbi:ATP-dependent DNA helicase RecQ [Aerococcaceae bacterium DSM 111176]|nr:ATP-dependent DNA helicase RecQ [Aerococcaceae bacterium DSM 111176]